MKINELINGTCIEREMTEEEIADLFADEATEENSHSTGGEAAASESEMFRKITQAIISLGGNV